MHIDNYLIDQSGVDWASILQPLHALLPKDLTVWLVNRYGDVIFVQADGSVHILDVGGTSVVRLADSREEFATLLDEPGNANSWLTIPLVNKCAEAGLQLQLGQCYSYRQAPILGGDYTVANTTILTLAEHYAYYGLLHDQTKALPDGAQVQFRISS